MMRRSSARLLAFSDSTFNIARNWSRKTTKTGKLTFPSSVTMRITLRRCISRCLLRRERNRNALIELLDNPAVQTVTGFVAERFPCDVANVRRIVDQQVHSLRQEVRKHLRRVTEHTAGVWDDVRRDGLR